MSNGGNSRLYDRVAKGVAAQIANGEFAIGERLPSERELALTYGVSRPTVREAVFALELDGLVEVRKGVGVFAIAKSPRGGEAAATDIGPFELLEARRAFEGEACAVAASRIRDADVEDLENLLREIDYGGDVLAAEDADRRFHLRIAEITGNSAMHAVVEMLWEARDRSPQYRFLTDKAHEARVVPREDEHAGILDALRSRDPARARAAMRSHIAHVVDSLLDATEVHELEQAKARVDEQRRKFTGSA
jgi:DNA-binding FadR family transcriptional regulator